MNTRILSSIVFSIALTAACAQDSPSAPPAGQAPAQGSGWQRQRGGRGGGGGMGMGMGRGLTGTVTEVAADHYTIRNDSGESFTVHFSANTRFVRQSAQGSTGGRGQSVGQGGGQAGGGGRGQFGGGGNPPQQIKPTEIKVGDAVAAMGEVDTTAKSIGAVMVMQLDPERAKQMLEMQANYGKTWLMGKIIGVDGVKVTLMGTVDNVSHAFVADENTTFRKRRDPITLADLQIGDTVRVEGAVKDGAFLATTVNAMGGPQGGNPTVPRSAPPQ
jgi:Domain of unknown function (DUF5666)